MSTFAVARFGREGCGRHRRAGGGGCAVESAAEVWFSDKVRHVSGGILEILEVLD